MAVAGACVPVDGCDVRARRFAHGAFPGAPCPTGDPGAAAQAADPAVGVRPAPRCGDAAARLGAGRRCPVLGAAGGRSAGRRVGRAGLGGAVVPEDVPLVRPPVTRPAAGLPARAAPGGGALSRPRPGADRAGRGPDGRLGSALSDVSVFLFCWLLGFAHRDGVLDRLRPGQVVAVAPVLLAGEAGGPCTTGSTGRTTSTTFRSPRHCGPRDSSCCSCGSGPPAHGSAAARWRHGW